jgi:VWFA-related protein
VRLRHLIVIAALAAGLGGAVTAAQQPIFRGASDTVRVFVTVTDRDGRLVTTLKQEQFEIRDEGRPQPITVFDNSAQPIRLIVMLDVSGSMQGNLPLLRASADQLFGRLRQGDQVKVGSFGKQVTISESFTGDAHLLRNALPDTIDPEAPTPLWRAIDDAMTAFGETREDERRVVLVLSDGKDSGPIGFKERFVSQGEVIDRARAEDVMIYGIGMRSRGTRAVPIGPGGLGAMLADDLPDPALPRVAEETGGGFTEVRFGQDLGAAFARVADELHTQYLIGFDPPKRDGKKHDLEVRLSERGLKARGRKSYVAPRE